VPADKLFCKKAPTLDCRTARREHRSKREQPQQMAKMSRSKLQEQLLGFIV
jgi:hypothetical protein